MAPEVQFCSFSAGGGRVEHLGQGRLRLVVPAGSARHYRCAQLDDYHQGQGLRLRWHPPVQLSLRARASAPDIPGTWGFGLWNDPFAASLGFAGATRTMPALPQAAWYFHASAPNYLALREGCPPHGFLAATFASIRLARAMLAAGLLVLPAFVVPAAAGLLRALARRIVRQDARLLTADPCEWHSYQLTWSAAAVRFVLDEEEIFVTSVSPQGPLGLVLWIDNQYMALPPGGRLRAGYLPADQPAWLELAELTVSSPTQP